MFVPLAHAPISGLRPADSGISASDWEILADRWYPLAVAAEVRNGPVAARLLDVDLVLFRGEDGDLACAVDLCPHRHVRLSGGTVENGQLICPFHGLRFDGSGQCRHVPALGRDARLPGSYRVRTFPVRTAYGLVWTCIGDPERHDIPHFPALDGVPDDDLAFLSPYVWPISAPRQVENFIDLAHLPFVHSKTLGGDATRPIKPGTIEEHDDAIVLTAKYIESNPDGSDRPSTFRYRIVMPFAVDFTTAADADPEHAMRSVDIPCPVGAYESMVFQIILMPGSTTEQKDKLVAALDTVNREDIALLSGLARAALPLNQKHEIHLPVDNIAHAYRRRLREMGLGR